MKTNHFFYFCLAIALLSLSSKSLNAQWQTSGNDIYYNSGNVGIGINAPVGTGTSLPMVDVRGNMYISNSSIGHSGRHYDEIGFNIGFTNSTLRR